MKKVFLSIAAFLIAQVSLFAQGIQATLITGTTPSQVVVRLKNASGAAVGGTLSSFTVGIRIPDQGANNPTITATGLSGTTAGGPITNVAAAVVNGGFAYYLIGVNYTGQTFPLAINEEKNLLGLSFFGTGGTAAVIPSVEMVSFADGNPPGTPVGTNYQLQYYISIGTDGTDYVTSFYATPGVSTGLNNASNPKTVGIASIPLSVTWMDFTATKSGEHAILDWATATEKGNTGFDVERSIDGKNFSKIGFVSTQANEGNSSEKLSYTFTDNKPFNGENHYRLKQIDIDGKSSYSKTSRVTFGGGTTSVQVYPNPATVGTVRVKGNNISNIAVYNIAGQQIQVPVTYGVSENVLNTSGLSSGNYTIRVNADGAVSNLKLVVQH